MLMAILSKMVLDVSEMYICNIKCLSLFGVHILSEKIFDLVNIK